MKVAIDGPAGAGKTTKSKALVKSLADMNMGYIDTGAMYLPLACVRSETTSRWEILKASRICSPNAVLS